MNRTPCVVIERDGVLLAMKYLILPFAIDNIIVQ